MKTIKEYVAEVDRDNDDVALGSMTSDVLHDLVQDLRLAVKKIDTKAGDDMADKWADEVIKSVLDLFDQLEK